MDDDTREQQEPLHEPPKAFYAMPGYEEVSHNDSLLLNMTPDWINLPVGPAGILHVMWNEKGKVTENKNKAVAVGAITADWIFWQFPVSKDTFDKPRMN